MTPQEALAEALRRGWSVIPIGLGKDRKAPLYEWADFQTRAATEAEVNAWKRNKKTASWAIVTGAVSGIISVDLDGPEGEDTRKRWGLKQNINTPRGAHVYVTHPGFRVPTLNGKAAKELGRRFPGVDVKGDGGYSIVCGSSIHGAYVPIHLDPYPWEFLPKDLRQFLQAESEKKRKKTETGSVLAQDLATSDPPQVTEEKPPARGPVLTAQGGFPSPETLLRKYLAEAVEGCRNDVGFHLWCQFRDNKYSQAEAEAWAPEYVQAVPGDGYTIEEALASVRQAYSEAPREPWGTGPQTEPAPVPSILDPETRPKLFTLADLLTGELAPVRWVVEGLVPAQGISVLGGDSGVGKSWLVYSLALCAAAGVDFLGQFPTQACPVLVFDAESGESLIRRRMRKLVNGLAGDGVTLPDDLPLRVFAGPLRLDGPKQTTGLADYLKREGVRLAIADPLIHSLPQGANENDSATMAKLFESVRYVMGETGCTFVFVHHSRKRSMTNPNDAASMLRGSSAIRGVLDSHLFLRKLRPGSLLCEHDKSRHAEALPNFTIEITDPDDTSTCVKWGGEAEEAADQTALAEAFIVRTLTDAGGTLKRQELLKLAEAEKLKERTLCNALTAGVEAGLLSKTRDGNAVVYTLGRQVELWAEG